MKAITATYTIVTPMFIGGADHNPSDGIRPPSVKGALRFWWRALNWGRCWKEAGKNEEAALHLLHKEEAALFGSSKEGDKGGQGCFLLTIAPTKRAPLTTKKGDVHPEFSRCSAARYLAYGLMESYSSGPRGVKAGQLTRGCVNEAQPFTVKILFKKEIEASIKEALIAWGLLGGLGSRSRHGLGSVALEKLEENGETAWEKPTTKKEYFTKLKSLLKNKLSANSPAPYTSFDISTQVELLCTAETPYLVLDAFAEPLLMYRSAGRGKRVLGNASEERFGKDHDWKYRVRDTHKRWDAEDIPTSFHPERIVFGLPQNYGNTQDLAVKPSALDRRSSPLLVHVHPVSSEEFLCISIFFPTLFLPEKETINAGGENVQCSVDYSLITNFLNGHYKKSEENYFPKKKVICKREEI